VKIMLQIANWN